MKAVAPYVSFHAVEAATCLDVPDIKAGLLNPSDDYLENTTRRGVLAIMAIGILADLWRRKVVA